MGQDKPDCMFDLLVHARVPPHVLTELQQQIRAYRRYQKKTSIKILAKDFRLSPATMEKWIERIGKLRKEAEIRGIPIMPGGKPF